MVTEDFVSLETAKLLKEKGFREHCTTAYYPKKTPTVRIDCPTLQMAMKWLREIHKIDITIDPHDVCGSWIYQFHLCHNREYLFSRDVDTTYEGACEVAIKYCLENLI